MADAVVEEALKKYQTGQDTAYQNALMQDSLQTPGNDNTRIKNKKWLTKDDFIWVAEENKFICPDGKKLLFQWVSRPKNGSPILTYAAQESDCSNCRFRAKCFAPKRRRRELIRKVFAEYQDAGRLRVGTAPYRHILRKRH